MVNDKSSSMLNNGDERSDRNYGMGKNDGILGGICGMAFIGAAIYFIQHATTFWLGVLGLIKSLVWPAMLIYHLLEFLKA